MVLGPEKEGPTGQGPLLPQGLPLLPQLCNFGAKATMKRTCSDVIAYNPSSRVHGEGSDPTLPKTISIRCCISWAVQMAWGTEGQYHLSQVTQQDMHCPQLNMGAAGTLPHTVPGRD